MHVCKQGGSGVFPEQNILLDKTPFKAVTEAKFLGLTLTEHFKQDAQAV